MLSSLPTIIPHDPYALWFPSLSTNYPPPPTTFPTDHPPNTNNHPQQPHHQQPHSQQHSQNRPSPQRILLTTLRSDESALLNRKANIRRFGAGWLRPPGVGKTLQGIADEGAEREEVEASRAREMAMQEAQAAAEAEGLGMEGVVGIREGEEEGERDLDEDVPDADGEEGEAGWMSEGEEEGTMLEDEGIGEGEFVDVDGEDGNLDDEVPEAEEGSYEHTDTEVEDSSSDDAGVVGGGRGPRLATFNTRTGEVVRTPGVGAGGVLGSSVFGSSPGVMPTQGIGSGRRGAGTRFGREN